MMIKQPDLNVFFKCLNKTNINYVLISNYYYEQQQAGDIDLYVPLQDKDIFLKAIDQLGFRCRRKPPVLPNHNFYLRFEDLFFMLLDVKYELSFYSRDGRIWLYNWPQRVISNRRMMKDSYRPDGFDALMLYAAHCSSLEKSSIEHRHVQCFKKYLTNFYNEINDPEQLKVLKNLELCLEGTDLQHLPQGLFGIIKPFFLIKKRFTWWYNFKLCFSSGMGFSILFLGADGTGKTTLIKTLQEMLPLSNRTLYLGMGEEGWILGWVQKYEKFCQKNARAQRFRLGLLLSWILLPLELFLRRLKSSLHGRYSILLIDRFPGFPFIQGGFLGWLYRIILPKPDQIVLLSGNPDSIARRKPEEITLERIEKELIKWAAVTDKIGAQQVLKLDTSREDVWNCVQKIIIAISDHPAFMQKILKPIKVSRTSD